MKAVKCFVTLKSIAIDERAIAISPPLSIDEFADVLAMFGDQTVEPLLVENRMREFGSKLFQRVFSGPAFDLYRSSAPMPLALAVSGELEALPWELLHDGTGWVAKTRGLVRVATTAKRAPEIIPKPGVLKVLIAIAGPIWDETIPADDPGQIRPIDVDSYVEMFQKLEGEPFPVEIKIRKHVTREVLSQELNGSYHVLHFVGHMNLGRLGLESKYATLDLVEESWTREQMAVALRGNLRLAIIDPCSPDVGEKIPRQAFNLLDTGVPAVIAMQGRTSELANSAFIKSIYSALAMGRSITEAVMDARHAMATDWQIGPHEWAMPVLFVNDSLLEKELNLMDAEMAKMMVNPKVGIVFPPQAELDPMTTRHQKFIGRRQELSDVLSSLDPENQDERVVCLYGDSGIGKTTIAIEAARRLAERFHEIIWLLLPNRKGNGDQGMRFLTALAYKCGFKPTGGETLEQIRDGILKSLRSDKKKLLVLDGIDSELERNSSAYKVIEDLLANLPSGCKALVVSREQKDYGKQIHIGMLKKHDSLKLLADYGGVKDVRANIKELNNIAHFAGGHPYLLRLIASQLASTERTLTALLKDLRKAKGNVFEHVFNSSLKLALRDGRRVFSAMSLLYPSSSRKAIQEVSGLSDSAFNKAIDRIVGLSLLESYQQGKRFGLHELARPYAEAGLLPADRAKFCEHMARFFSEFVKASAPMTKLSTATQALAETFTKDTPKAQLQEAAMQFIVKPATHLLEAELNNCLSALDWALDRGDLCSANALIDGLHEFLMEHGYWDVILYYYGGVAEGWRKLGDKRALALASRNIGMTYSRMGRLEDAQRCYENVLELAREIQDKGLEAGTLGELSLLYAQQGDQDRAIKCLEDSRSIFQSLGDKSREAWTLIEIGSLLKQAGQWESAIQCFETSNQILSQLNERQGMASALFNLGECYQNLGQYASSMGPYEESLRIYRELDDKEGQSYTLNNLGAVYQDQGELDRAIQCYQDSLKIRYEIGDETDQANLLNKIALAKARQKNWSSANDCLIKSFTISARTRFSAVIDSLRCILSVSKDMLKSGEFVIPAQTSAQLSQLIQQQGVVNDELRIALAISQGVFTIIGFSAICEWNKESNTYKEALELARSLDETTGSALKLVEWLE